MKFNIPNILTFIRFLLIPVFVIVYFSEIEFATIIAAGVFIIASITDVLDGYIARKYNLITEFGKVIDPLADKLMQLAVFVCIYISGLLPLWFLVIFILKEFSMIIGGAILLKKKKKVVQSKWYGKLTTVLFFIVIIILISIKEIDRLYTNILLTIPLISMVFSLIMYLIEFNHSRKNIE